MARPYKLLRDLLHECEITNEMLATELGIRSPATVSRKLNDHSSWTLDEMYRILEVLGESPERLHIIFPKNGINEPGVKRRISRRPA